MDTGADITILKKNVFDKIGRCSLQKCVAHLCGLGNKITRPIGYFVAQVMVDDIQTLQKFVVVADRDIAYDALLGFDFISKFNLTTTAEGYKFSPLSEEETYEDFRRISIYNVAETNSDVDVPSQYEDEVRAMISNYKPANSVTECPVVLKITPDGDMVPFRHSPSRMPVTEIEAVNKQIDEWLNAGIVRQSSSNFASRIVVVKKKDGTRRICIDFRKLNSAVLKDCFRCR